MTSPFIHTLQPHDHLAAALAHLVLKQGGYIDLPSNVIRAGLAAQFSLECRCGDVLRIRVVQSGETSSS